MVYKSVEWPVKLIVVTSPFDQPDWIEDSSDCLAVTNTFFPDGQLQVDHTDINESRLREARKKNDFIIWPDPVGVWIIKNLK